MLNTLKVILQIALHRTAFICAELPLGLFIQLNCNAT